MLPREFVCADCQAMVFDYSGDPRASREYCYNCMFVRRVADTPEQEAELRRVLDCERREVVSDGHSGV